MLSNANSRKTAIANLLRLEMAYRGSTLYLGFNQEWCAHPSFSGGRLDSNLPVSARLLGVEPGARCDSRQPQC